MSLFSHATHLHIPDQDTGRLVASAMLRSDHSIIISKPYGKWINAYLPMGLSYKDVKEFPPATAIELNCFEGEGLEFKFFTHDRLAIHVESGMGDIAEQEDELLEIASEIWEEENPEQAQKIKALHESVTQVDSDSVDEEEPVQIEKLDDFWSLSDAEQKPYLEKAKQSEKFKSFQKTTSGDTLKIDEGQVASVLPEGRTAKELTALLEAIIHRFDGAPSDQDKIDILEKTMDGKTHSEDAADYVRALQNFFQVKGSLWSLEKIQESHSDLVDRRIVNLNDLPDPT